MQLSVPLAVRPRAVRLGRLGLAIRLGLCALIGALVLLGGEPPRSLRIHQAAGPYAFVLLDWELTRLGERSTRIGPSLLGRQPQAGADERAAVARYFDAPAGAREPLRARAEAAIERTLTPMLAAEGLTVPMPLAPEGRIVFPPVSFSFVAPPQVLIVSPRDRIAVSQSELLRPDVSTRQAESLEATVDSLGVSALVVPIGGLATYPAMVLEDTLPLDALVGVAHEWIHGYLFFHPLGRAYWSSQAARTINETAAEMASRELGARLADDLGLTRTPRAGPRPAGTGAEGASTRPAGRDFRVLMRATRARIDTLLTAGRIDEAEAYMRERRDELAGAGFEVRRLNQAYFAFYGSYGDGAAGSDPIPARLQRLREASSSVGDFLRRVAELTDADDLARALGDA